MVTVFLTLLGYIILVLLMIQRVTYCHVL